MKIIACIKQVPDSEAKVKAEGGQISLGDAPLVINPFDEYAVEGALQQREAVSGSTVTALCVGPESAKEALKHALAMGADRAVLVADDDRKFDTMRSLLFTDHDVLVLFDPSMDGAEIAGGQLERIERYANLHPRDWFTPFAVS